MIRYSVIAITASSLLIAGCSSTRSSEVAGLSSDGVQGPVVTAPAIAINTLEDGSVETQSLGVRTYSTSALELINTLKPVSFEFLDSGELHTFSIDGADPVVVAAGGQIVAKSIMVDAEGRVVSWEPLDKLPPVGE